MKLEDLVKREDLVIDHLITLTNDYVLMPDGHKLTKNKRRTPLLSAARYMRDKGYSLTDTIGLTRDGKTVDLYGTIDGLAPWDVTEEASGPRFRPYRYEEA